MLFEMILNPGSIFFWLLIIAIIAGAVMVISRPFSTYVKFVYPNAKFEAIGNPYIEDTILTGLVDRKNLTDFKEAINASKDYKIEGETSYEIQESLDNSFLKTIEMMKKDSSKKMNEFYDLYLEKMDIYLIKKILKNKIFEKSIQETLSDKAILQKTKDIIQELIDSDKENLPIILKKYGFSELIIDAISDKDKDLLYLDNSIDKFIIEKFKKLKVPYKCESGKQTFVKTMIDISNIKNALRAKQLKYDDQLFMKLFLGDGHEIASWKYKEISEAESVEQVISSLEGTSYYNCLKDSIEDYNKEKSVQVFENALDSYFLKIVRDISTKNYVTIGPTIRFLTSKEFEIRNLKIIAKGVYENLPSELINKYLIKEAVR